MISKKIAIILLIAISSITIAIVIKINTNSDAQNMSNKQILEPKKDIKNENDHWKELTKVRNTTIGNGENILKDSFSNPSTSKPEKTHK